MPAEAKAFSKCAEDEPTDCILMCRSGPRPASSGEPVRLPSGMASSRVETSESLCSTSASTADCNRLNSAMLLLTAVMCPSLSFSSEIRRS